MQKDIAEAKTRFNLISMLIMILFIALSFVPFIEHYGDYMRTNAYGFVRMSNLKIGINMIIRRVWEDSLFALAALILAIVCVIVFFVRVRKKVYKLKIVSFLPALVAVCFFVEIIKDVNVARRYYFYEIGPSVGFFVEIILLLAVLVIQIYAETGLKKEKPEFYAMYDMPYQGITGNENEMVHADGVEVLKKYKVLLDQGVITPEEFATEKKKILGL